MLIQDFAEKVEAVKRYRAAQLPEQARITKTMGASYRVALPFPQGQETFVLKGPELTRLMAEFPGVDALWELFRPADRPTGAALVVEQP
jgi:hypothetical protein